ncbi:2Fe-2S iron-sulfur cluster-binding protein [Spirochaetia bacterium 38H-sp]|uniref:2Fe-2S iron-sulfur cluster-binding protein n=1 Tax=Rarispira pelagica TaxID=3141764 RepID=A0ABU9UBX6_9SPIR
MLLTCKIDNIEIKRETNPAISLKTFLKETLKIINIKGNCDKGYCGNCGVTISGQYALSCLVPVFMIQKKEIFTIQGFSTTEEYKEIEKIFLAKKVFPCPACAPARILLAHSILENAHNIMEEKNISDQISGINCTCISKKDYASVILEIQKEREKRHDKTR